MAFNYTNFDGTYDDGGGFDKDIFSPLLYATFLPFERASSMPSWAMPGARTQ